MSGNSAPASKPFVFIHIPKTAGTAFRVAALKALGENAVHRHYKATSPDTSESIRQTVMSQRMDLFADQFLNGTSQLLCGHFAAREYAAALDKRVRWCTIIRDPVDRVLSEYAHILRKSAAPEERRKTLPIETFIERPKQINKQTRMLQGLSIDDFAWIGESENFTASIAAFNQQFDLAFPAPRANIGNWNLLNGAHEDSALRTRIAELNQLDMALITQLRAHPSIVQARQLAR